MAYAFNITQLIGNTPLLKLQRIVAENSATVLVKLESRNPGGSVKDRIGLAMIQAAEKSGKIKSGATIVEATSGNTGIALAMIAAARGYHCLLTLPETVSVERQQLLRFYGAEIILTSAGEGMRGAVSKAQDIAENTPGAYLPAQFENPANPEVHRLTTAQEIWSGTDGLIDAFVCGVGTGGTITGVARVFKNRNPRFQAIAVEPAESPVIAGGTHTPHRLEDIGMGFIPKNLDVDLLDDIVSVSSDEADNIQKRLLAEEGVSAGMSSGASVCAALRVAQQLGPGKTVVTMVHDSGERYLRLG